MLIPEGGEEVFGQFIWRFVTVVVAPTVFIVGVAVAAVSFMLV
jgi:RecG-like helicase